MTCPACYKTVEENFGICPHCGKILQKRERGNLILPPNPITRPLSTFEYLVMIVLSVISPVNIILFLVWSFAPYVNLNRKRFARAYLIIYAFLIVAIVSAWFILREFYGIELLKINF
jgi:hypothetical protein